MDAKSISPMPWPRTRMSRLDAIYAYIYIYIYMCVSTFL